MKTAKRTVFAAMLGATTILGACSDAADSTQQTKGAEGGSAQSDEGAMADLQASRQWQEPRCRWLKTGTWIAAYPQDTAVYRAAADLGYIEMTEVGQVNRIGRPEPAWKIVLTDAGKAESATCSPATPPNFGVPVSRRQFVSAKRTEVDYSGYTVFHVDFIWVPTPAGDRVRHELTGNMTVEEGPARAIARLDNRPRSFPKGPNGWAVIRLDDRRRDTQ